MKTKKTVSLLIAGFLAAPAFAWNHQGGNRGDRNNNCYRTCPPRGGGYTRQNYYQNNQRSYGQNQYGSSNNSNNWSHTRGSSYSHNYDGNNMNYGRNYGGYHGDRNNFYQRNYNNGQQNCRPSYRHNYNGNNNWQSNRGNGLQNGGNYWNPSPRSKTVTGNYGHH